MATKKYYEGGNYEMVSPKAITKKGFLITRKQDDEEPVGCFSLAPAMALGHKLYDNKKTLLLTSNVGKNFTNQDFHSVLKIARQYALDNNSNLYVNINPYSKIENKVVNNIQSNGVFIPMTFDELKDASKYVDSFTINLTDEQSRARTPHYYPLIRSTVTEPEVKTVYEMSRELSTARRCVNCDLRLPENVKFNINLEDNNNYVDISTYDENDNAGLDLSNIKINNNTGHTLNISDEKDRFDLETELKTTISFRKINIPEEAVNTSYRVTLCKGTYLVIEDNIHLFEEKVTIPKNRFIRLFTEPRSEDDFFRAAKSLGIDLIPCYDALKKLIQRDIDNKNKIIGYDHIKYDKKDRLRFEIRELKYSLGYCDEMKESFKNFDNKSLSLEK